MFVVGVILIVVVVVTMVMIMMFAAAQQPRADYVHHQADHGNWDCLRKADRNRRQKSYDRLIADEGGDHCEHDGAAKAGQLAELSGSKYETRVVGMPTRVGIGECRDQHGACVGRL